MVVEYAHGSNGTVYLVEPWQQGRFPEAQLVKPVQSPDRFLGLRLYIRLLMGHLVLGDHVINPVGVDIHPPIDDQMLVAPSYIGEIRKYPVRQHLLYTQEAPIHPDHAQYSSHSESNPYGGKDLCYCLEGCQQHHYFHQENQIGAHARQIELRAREAGLVLPGGDSTDFCLRQDGIVTFFEVDGLDTEIFRAAEEVVAHPQRDRLLRLADSYDQLLERSNADQQLFQEQFELFKLLKSTPDQDPNWPISAAVAAGRQLH